YILTNKFNSVLYIGMTGDLEGRIQQHKTKEVEGFTSKYNVNKLVYYEKFPTALEAITREKQLKNWKRKWKQELIESNNREYQDLAVDWFEK
ncbi:MAG: GIY-YIG nuclease family protein, partial [Patescibacteria group bacterium]